MATDTRLPSLNGLAKSAQTEEGTEGAAPPQAPRPMSVFEALKQRQQAVKEDAPIKQVAPAVPLQPQRPETPKAPTPQAPVPAQKPTSLADALKSLKKPGAEPVQQPAVEKPKPTGLAESLKKHVDDSALKEAQELQEYTAHVVPSPEMKSGVERGITIVTRPPGGATATNFPTVPDGAYDEVGELQVEKLPVVDYYTGQEIWAAFGDKTELQGLLQASGFKPVYVYFMPPPSKKTRAPQWKWARMYAAKDARAKDAFEKAYLDPNDPTARKGRQLQEALEQKQAEGKRQLQKFQDSVSSQNKATKAYSDAGYDEDSHRASYAHIARRHTVVPVPDHPGKKPLAFKPYQLAAVDFLNDRLGGPDDAKPDAERGAVLADSPGIGKTMPAIGVINSNPSIKKVLIVCPAVMVPVWQRELKKWLAGEHVRDSVTNRLKVSIGKYKKGDPLPDITVLSYEALRNASGDLGDPKLITGDPEATKGAWDYVVLDESHRVKDEHSVQACVIMGGKPKRRKSNNPMLPEVRLPGEDSAVEYPGIPSKRRLLITGTPIPSYAWELYANLHFVRPDIFDDEDEFLYQFAVMKAFHTTVWKKDRHTGAPELHRTFITKPIRPQNLTLLNRMLFGGGTYHKAGKSKHFQGIIMRRIHSDLQGRPELGDSFNLPPRPKPKYLKVDLPDEEYSGLDARSQELQKLEQRMAEARARGASDDELASLEHEYGEKVKVAFQRVSKVRKAIGLKKAPANAKYAAHQAAGESQGRANQVLVFAYHKEVIDKLAQDIRREFTASGHPQWKVAVVYGATSDKQRETTFQQFQSDPDVRVIVASYKVLKEGITLTAANKVVHAELMPNPTDYEQAYARAWRNTQDREVEETFSHLPHSFDQRLFNIASGKDSATKRILDYRLPEQPQRAASTHWWPQSNSSR
ncbi:MAG: hypothetical protein JSS66_05535 [Armatimonadetes bacterium]|nr:hypothetical protein [Armatimonadota bacterium]